MRASQRVVSSSDYKAEGGGAGWPTLACAGAVAFVHQRTQERRAGADRGAGPRPAIPGADSAC